MRRMEWHRQIPIARYGKAWRQGRKLFVAIFTGGQGDETAYRAVEIRFRGADGGVGRDNE
jgi:hypothetical protein